MTLALLVVVGAAYARWLRQPILTWGATDEEAAGPLPGDDLLEAADGVATRAIDVDAPAAAVWPWLAQMGPAPRGGAYTYDWIENLLGLDMHSVDRVLPEFQHPQVGDTIGYGPNRMRVERVERERVLAWRSEDGNWVWTFVLAERDEATRLISRNRFRLPSLAARLGMLPMEPASLVMEQKMLRGIKERAERLAAAPDGRPTRAPRGPRAPGPRSAPRAGRGCSAQERQRRAVVGRDEGGDLRTPAARASATSSAASTRADPAALVLVDDLEGDLGARAVADDARERDGPRVALEVADERVTRRVDGGEVRELGVPQARLRAVEACPSRALAEPLEDVEHGLHVAVAQGADQRAAARARGSRSSCASRQAGVAHAAASTERPTGVCGCG